MQAWLPQTEPFTLQGANHALEEMDPCGVAEAMAAFFARHPMPVPAAAPGRADDSRRHLAHLPDAKPPRWTSLTVLVEDRSTVKRYASFLLRCWRLGDDQRRIEIEHMQSGARTRVRSMVAAVEWIDGRCDRCDAPDVAAPRRLIGAERPAPEAEY